MKDNELITRKNIELALLNKGQHSRRYRLGDIWELNYDEIREVLDGVDADVQPVRWIPCSERLPEKNVWVLVTFMMANGEVDIDIMRINRWDSAWETRDFDMAYRETVVAWKPKPEPWRKDN